MEEKKTTKNNFVIGFIIGLIIVALLTLIYFVFIKKEDKPQDVVPNNTNTEEVEPVVKSDKIELLVEGESGESVDSIKLGNNTYNFKLAKNNAEKYELYLNNERIDLVDYSSLVIKVVGKNLIVEWPGAQAGSLAIGYVDENSSYYNLFNDKTLLNIREDNGKLYCDIEVSGSGEYNIKSVELTLSGATATTE